LRLPASADCSDTRLLFAPSPMKSVDEVKDIRDTAEALRAAARVAKNKQAEIDMAEIRIRGHRRLGELMELQRQAGAMNAGGRPSETGLRTNPVSAAPTLADAGIDKNLADRARKFAAIPETEFEGILADRRERFQQEDERVTVNLMEAGEKHVRTTEAEHEFDPLQSAWDAAGEAERKAFLARNNLTSLETAMKGEGHVDRSAERASSAVKVGAPVSNSSTTSSRKTNSPAPTSSPTSGTILKALSKADQIRLLRPNCRHADDLDKCGGNGKTHCRDCKVSEA
jgi:hypothetical protein